MKKFVLLIVLLVVLVVQKGRGNDYVYCIPSGSVQKNNLYGASVYGYTAWHEYPGNQQGRYRYVPIVPSKVAYYRLNDNYAPNLYLPALGAFYDGGNTSFSIFPYYSYSFNGVNYIHGPRNGTFWNQEEKSEAISKMSVNVALIYNSNSSHVLNISQMYTWDWTQEECGWSCWRGTLDWASNKKDNFYNTINISVEGLQWKTTSIGNYCKGSAEKVYFKNYHTTNNSREIKFYLENGTYIGYVNSYKDDYFIPGNFSVGQHTIMAEANYDNGTYRSYITFQVLPAAPTIHLISNTLQSCNNTKSAEISIKNLQVASGVSSVKLLINSAKTTIGNTADFSIKSGTEGAKALNIANNLGYYTLTSTQYVAYQGSNENKVKWYLYGTPSEEIAKLGSGTYYLYVANGGGTDGACNSEYPITVSKFSLPSIALNLQYKDAYGTATSTHSACYGVSNGGLAFSVSTTSGGSISSSVFRNTLYKWIGGFSFKEYL